VLAHLAAHMDCSLAEVRELGATPAHLAKLEQGGWLKEYQQQVERDPLAQYSFTPKPPPELSADQQAAVDVAWSERITLLHGVTGSGKDRGLPGACRQGTGERRRARSARAGNFADANRPSGVTASVSGETLTVLHSQLSTASCSTSGSEYCGEARLVVGSRSAVFAPAHNLQLVVLD